MPPGSSRRWTARARRDIRIPLTPPQIALVCGTTATWIQGGYDAGLDAGKSARAQASAVGVAYPAAHAIRHADDFEDTSAQITTVLDCLRGCAVAEGSRRPPGTQGASIRIGSRLFVLVREPLSLGALGAIRTRDLPLRRRLLYPLSYKGRVPDCGQLTGWRSRS
jgi:hypothetical protein